MNAFQTWLLSDVLNAIGPLLLDSAIKATVVLLIAGGLAALLGRASAAVRHRVWCLSLAALLILPALSWLLPEWRVPILPVPAQETLSAVPAPIVVSDATDATRAPAPSADFASNAGPTTDRARRFLPSAKSPDAPWLMGDGANLPSASEADAPGAALEASSTTRSPMAATHSQAASTGGPAFPATMAAIVIAWLVGLLVMLVPLGIAVVRIPRLRAGIASVPDGPWIELRDELCRRLRVRRPVYLMETSRPLVPMTFGVIRPVVLLPRQARGWSEPLCRSVLLHELAHVKRCDVAFQMLGRLACAVYWFHPLAWYALRRLRVERELACDDCVLNSGQRPSDYAEQLLEIARRFQPVGLCAAVAMARHSDLESRVRALLDRTRSHLPLSSAAARLLLLSAVLLVTGLAVIRPGPRALSNERLEFRDESLGVGDGSGAILASGGSTTGSSSGQSNERSEGDADAADDEEADGSSTARMKKIIRKVQKNEALYRNLEVALRRETRVASEEDPNTLSDVQEALRQRIVWQDDLIYFRGEEPRKSAAGETAPFKRLSAFDGEKTRSVVSDNSVNIHHGRFESQHVYPPHTWALSYLRVNFPLSVLLQGTEAINRHPKVHDYPREWGSVFGFTKVEPEFVGEETVGGLRCLKIRCRRWYYSDDDPVIHTLWLAPQRNYLCVKSETQSRFADGLARSEAIVDEFREIAPGLWLPAKVTVKSYDYQALREGKQVLASQNTLVLEEAIFDPDRPKSFFSDIEIPSDLPVFEIKNGHLVGTDFRDREPAHDAKERMRRIVEKIRTNEQKYQSFGVELVNTYQKLGSIILGGDRFIVTTSKRTQEHSIQQAGRTWFSEQSSTESADGSTSRAEHVRAFDGGEWLRGFRSRTRKDDGKSHNSVYATLVRGGGHDIPVHRPHMLLYRESKDSQLLSAYLTSPWSDKVNRYPHQVDYIGEDTWNGLHCVVIRDAFIPQGKSDISSYRLIWLATERNYLPIRYESYALRWCEDFPSSIGLATDLREIAPGVWYPFRVEILKFQNSDVTDLSVDRLVLNWRTDYTIQKATLNPEVPPNTFVGPTVPAGTKVVVRDEDNDSLGDFQQPKTGPLAISREKFLEMRNKANQAEQEEKERQAALDALLGKPAPTIPKGKWLGGPPLSWDELSGKVVIVSFWAEWCGPCKPGLERLAEMHKTWQALEKTDAVVIGIHTAGSERSAIEKVIEEYKVEYPVYIDTPPENGDGWGTLFNRFAVHAIPHTFVIDQDGKVAAHGRQLEKMISKAGQLARDGQERADSRAESTGRDEEESSNNSKPARPDASPSDDQTKRSESEKNLRVAGRVLDPDGEPHAHATVWVQQHNPTEWTRIAFTDENGQFNVSIDRTRLDASLKQNPDYKIRIAATAEGFGMAWARVEPSALEGLTLKLPEEVPIEGRIVTLEGTPAVGVTLRVDSISVDEIPEIDKFIRSAAGSSGVYYNTPPLWLPGGGPGTEPIITDAEGRFRIEGLGAERVVRLEAAGGGIGATRLAIVTRPAPSSETPGGVIAVKEGLAESVYYARFTHAAVPGRTLQGVVTDEKTGDPLAGVRVTADQSWHSRENPATIGADGRYKITSVPKQEEYELLFEPQSSRHFNKEVKIENPPGLEPVDVNVSLPKGITVRGRVTDAETGEPLEGTVTYNPLFPNENVLKLGTRLSIANPAATEPVGNDGTYEISVLPGPGAIAVKVSGEGYVSASVDADRLREFLLEDDLKMITNAHGEIRALPTAAGDQSRGIMGLNQCQAAAIVNFSEDTKEKTINLTAARGRSRRGMIEDDAGRPLADVTVVGLGTNGISVTRPPLEMNEFTVKGLVPGCKRTLLFVHHQRELGAEVVVSGDETDPLAVRMTPTGTVTGRFVDKLGNGRPGIMVELSPQQPPIAGLGLWHAETDKQGRFHITGLIAGTKYRVEARPIQQHGPSPFVTGDVRVEPGKTLDLGMYTRKNQYHYRRVSETSDGLQPNEE